MLSEVVDTENTHNTFTQSVLRLMTRTATQKRTQYENTLDELIPELEGMYVFAELGQGLDSALLFYGDPTTGEIFEFQIDPMGPIFPEDDGPGNLLPDRILSIGEDLQ